MNDELLIALVKENALIYDPEDPKYMDAAYKVKVWNNIAQKLNSTGAQCKARWSNIRDNYRKWSKKFGSTSALAAKKVRPYRFAQQLGFLTDYKNVGRDIYLQHYLDVSDSKGNIPFGEYEDEGSRNLEDGTDEAEEVEDYFPPEVVPTIETPEATTSSDLTSMSVLPRTNKRKQPPESTSPTPVKYLMSKNYNQEFNDTPKLLGTLEHPVDVFLYAISPTLKSLSPLLLNMAKSEIFATVQKFEKKMLEEQNAASSCPLPRQGYDGDLPPVSN